MGAILGIINGVISLANKTMAYFTKKDDQNTGRQLQNADNLTANAKADENAAIIEDRNAALSRDALIDKLRGQTGVRP